MALGDLTLADLNNPASWPVWLKATATGLVVALILGGGYWFLIQDQIAALERTENEERQLRQSFLDKKALAINLEAYRQQMTEMQETFGVLLKQLPNQSEVPELLIDITQAGLARGLEFVQFKPGGLRQADFYSELPINLTVKGTYHQLGQFVSDLAALPRIVTIGDLALKPIANSNRLQMSAVTRTFHYLDEAAIQARQQQQAQQRARAKR
jgi:type IV pilus assembly protein PilO